MEEHRPSQTNTLTQLIYKRKKNNQRPYTLILGAGASLSSGCSSNKELIEEVVRNFIGDISCLNENEILEKFYKFIERKDDDQKFVILMEFVKAIKISKGYNYLAELIKEGYFDFILTTNFDPLLEEAINKIMKPTEFKILIREEVNEDRIIRILEEFDTPRVKVLKLHGDLNSRIFIINPSAQGKISQNLNSTLRKKLKKTIIVGHSMWDRDIIECLQDAQEIWYVNREKPLFKDPIWGILQEKNSAENVISGENGDFDKFFHDLYWSIMKSRLEEVDPKTQKKIISVLEEEVAYEEEAICVTWKNAIDSIRELACKVQLLGFDPDLILPIYDPDFPGGEKVGKEILKYFKDVDPKRIKIVGRGTERIVKPDEELEELNKILKEHRKILLIDDIAFAGKTIKIAVDYIKKVNPFATIKAAVLVISRKLERELKDSGNESNIFFVKSTDRCEIFFPWGWVQATGDLERVFPGVAGGEKYGVHWIKRPWGATEIFAENKFCSVKLHTISPGECLSLQTHFCRDEFFVALDENIGLQIGDKYLVLEKGDYRLIPRGIKHRFYGYKDRVRVLEVAFGFYDQKGDIIREEDKFERDPLDGSV